MTDLSKLSKEDLKELRRITEQRLRDFAIPGARENNVPVYARLNAITAEETARYNCYQRQTTPVAAQWVVGGDAVVYLPFSTYELANIAEMFKAIVPYRFLQGEEQQALDHNHPLGVFNSGDWTGVVADRFVEMAKQYAHSSRANVSWDEYRAGALRGYV